MLVIGQYLDQLKELASALEAPLITGATPARERERLYERFRSGEVRLLGVSKVANFSIDVPEAFLAEQGYRYEIRDEQEVLAPAPRG